MTHSGFYMNEDFLHWPSTGPHTSPCGCSSATPWAWRSAAGPCGGGCVWAGSARPCAGTRWSSDRDPFKIKHKEKHKHSATYTKATFLHKHPEIQRNSSKLFCQTGNCSQSSKKHPLICSPQPYQHVSSLLVRHADRHRQRHKPDMKDPPFPASWLVKEDGRSLFNSSSFGWKMLRW